MENNFKKGNNVLWILLSPRDVGPIVVMLTLSLYTLSILILIHFMSITRDGNHELSKEKWIIIGICALSIEILNQITYWLAKINEKIAVVFKAVLFWCVFTAGINRDSHLLFI
jgi:hypothetical protein